MSSDIIVGRSKTNILIYLKLISKIYIFLRHFPVERVRNIVTYNSMQLLRK